MSAHAVGPPLCDARSAAAVAPCSYNDGTGRQALFRMPGRGAKGTCIFIHGCYHDPYSWFYKGGKCPMCTGASAVCWHRVSAGGGPAPWA